MATTAKFTPAAPVKVGDTVTVNAGKVGAGRVGTVLEVRTLRSGRVEIRVRYDSETASGWETEAHFERWAASWNRLEKYTVTPAAEVVPEPAPGTKLGDMTPAQREMVTRRAATMLQDELTRNAPALAAILDAPLPDEATEPTES